MPSQRFDFQSSKENKLSGLVEHPETTPLGWAILAHCFTCGKDSLAATRLARGLAYAGIGVLRFDFAGIGKSGGDFAETTFSADVDDLAAAAEAMTAAGMPPSVLIGHSLGGAAVLAAADKIRTARAVATIAAPARVADILRQFDKGALERIRSDGEAEVYLAGRPYIVRQSFVDDVQNYDLKQHVERLHLPLLIMHAPNDDTVELSNASSIFASAKHPRSFVSLGDADHLLAQPAEAQLAARVIAAWADRYLAGFSARLFNVERSG
ncbi:alpha/beta fold hydrolase [Microvirga lotononidis]|uniref:Prolyl oligopeptidase family protein n=1 Tax=Microvirga lotononidis TaxID=864069 RepID=I4YRB8_9HYPH|nr:alpha/beta fold hydrolase [Microvirga lotononidis]EIM26510.1 prolyl oligopeptidase family protein [Microvirga lotononidis]WQO31194.1 alpha/beta fold hydrolase [Microvirga lotononidis]